ncbi:MAG: SDR family NAD(P)-dependent oxidoreductase [Terriglobia bacterium]
MRLEGKIAIVTGAASDVGIGRAIAMLFAKEGAKLALADIDEAGGKQAVESIRKQRGQAIFCRTDIARSADVERLTKTTTDEFGAINILVNNAAHMKDSAAAADMTEEQWDRSINVTLKGAFLCAKYAIPEMRRARGGSIVNISSVGGLVGFGGDAAYCSAKGGIMQLTKSLAIDYGRDNIRVNAICPGPIETSISPKDDEELYQYQIAMTVLGRRGRPLDVAYGALFLASDESSFITGSNLVVDGGWTVR